MYIAMNRIAAPEGQEQAMIEGFKHAVPGMKRFNGFIGLELWTAEDGTYQTRFPIIQQRFSASKSQFASWRVLSCLSPYPIPS